VLKKYKKKGLAGSVAKLLDCLKKKIFVILVPKKEELFKIR